MSVYRPHITRYVDFTGKRCRKTDPGAIKKQERSKTYRGKYRDADNVLREISLCKNKQASLQMLAEYERKATEQRAGITSVFENHTKTPLKSHLNDFRNSLLNKGRSRNHCELVANRALYIIEDCKFNYITEISASRVERSLADLKKSLGRSQQTVNHYLRAIKQFTRWLLRDKRSPEDRLSHLEAGNVKLDRRLERRELASDEIEWLLKTTMQSAPVSRLSGQQRATLYLTALGTGLRASELASLRKKHLKLTEDMPYIVIDAAFDKSRRGYEIMISTALASILKAYSNQLKESDLLWPGKWAAQKRASIILKKDLQLARQAWIEAAKSEPEKQQRADSEFLKYRNSDGQADFHALRHTFMSRLGRSGASAKVMQKLARHSSVELTIGRYTHTNKQDLHQAVELMDQGLQEPNEGKPGESVVAQMVASLSDNCGKNKQIAADNCRQQPTENQQLSESSNSLAEQRVAEKREPLLTTAKKRRGGDSNPRYLAAHRFSRPARSATPSPLR